MRCGTEPPVLQLIHPPPQAWLRERQAENLQLGAQGARAVTAAKGEQASDFAIASGHALSKSTIRGGSGSVVAQGDGAPRHSFDASAATGVAAGRARGVIPVGYAGAHTATAARARFSKLTLASGCASDKSAAKGGSDTVDTQVTEPPAVCLMHPLPPVRQRARRETNIPLGAQ
eukprot:IDg2812t1